MKVKYKSILLMLYSTYIFPINSYGNYEIKDISHSIYKPFTISNNASQYYHLRDNKYEYIKHQHGKILDEKNYQQSLITPFGSVYAYTAINKNTLFEYNAVADNMNRDTRVELPDYDVRKISLFNESFLPSELFISTDGMVTNNKIKKENDKRLDTLYLEKISDNGELIVGYATESQSILEEIIKNNHVAASVNNCQGYSQCHAFAYNRNNDTFTLFANNIIIKHLTKDGKFILYNPILNDEKDSYLYDVDKKEKYLLTIDNVNKYLPEYSEKEILISSIAKYPFLDGIKKRNVDIQKISDNGQVFIGQLDRDLTKKQLNDGKYPKIAFVTKKEGPIKEINLSNYGSSKLAAISADGNYSVGWGEAWHDDYQVKLPHGIKISSALFSQALLYDLSNNILSNIGNLSNKGKESTFRNARATDISADGKYIVGWSETDDYNYDSIPKNQVDKKGTEAFIMFHRHAFVHSDNKMLDLGTLNEGKDSEAHTITDDGRVIYGISTNNNNEWRQVAWKNSNITDNHFNKEKQYITDEKIRIEADTRAKAEQERLEKERADRAKAEQERIEKERADRAKAEQERLEKERADRAKAEQERLEKERADRAKAEQERIEKERADRAKAEQERLEKERADRAKAEQERLEKERADRAKAEQERIEKERADRAKAEQERLEKERADRAKAEQERLEKERADRAKAEQERLEKERADRAKAEQERLNKERADRAKAEQERLEKERADRAKAEQERLNKERADRAKAEQERLDKERADKAKAEQERLDKERADRAKAEQERLEKERADRAKAEQERLEKERADEAKAEQERADEAKAEQERLNKELADKAKVDAQELIPVDDELELRAKEKEKNKPSVTISKPIDIENTYKSMQLVAENSYKFMDMQQGQLRYLASATCSVGTKKACISGFTHYQNVNKANATQTGLSGAYRFDVNHIPLIVGLAIDTDVYSSLPKGYQYQGYALPLIGFSLDLMPSLNAELNNNALHLSLKGAYLNRKVSIERQALANTEQGKGNAKITGYHIELQGYYPYSIADDLLLTPFAGLTFNQISRSAYSETQNAQFAAHYDALKTHSLLAKMGLGMDYLLGSSFILNTKAGLLWNLSHHQGDFRSQIDYLGQQHIDYSENKKPLKQRPFAHVGLTYQFDKQSSINTSANWEMTPYRNHDMQFGISYTYRF